MQTRVKRVVYPRTDYPQRAEWLAVVIQTQRWPAIEQLLDTSESLEFVLGAVRER